LMSANIEKSMRLVLPAQGLIVRCDLHWKSASTLSLFPAHSFAWN
jgi:hypothetical protein